MLVPYAHDHTATLSGVLSPEVTQAGRTQAVMLKGRIRGAAQGELVPTPSSAQVRMRKSCAQMKRCSPSDPCQGKEMLGTIALSYQ